MWIKWKGKRIGRIENGVFIKPVKWRKHHFHKIDAWCIQVEIYDSFRPDFHTLRYEDKANRKAYEVSAAIHDVEGFKIDQGHGPQYAVTAEHWQEFELTGKQGVLV